MRSVRRVVVFVAVALGVVVGGAVSVPDDGDQRVAAFVVVDDSEMQHCEPLRHT